MARYDVTVRVRTGWPFSASGLFEMRRAGRRLPGPLRLRGTLIHVEGDLEVVLRTHGVPAPSAIHQTRLVLPMLGLRRDRIRRIDVRRTHPLRRHRTLVASWLPSTGTPAPGPRGPGLPLSATHHPAA
jgi:hypothetical protein